eukprot:scaffold37642_cov30-Tisochrysis_lutea.AAC.3
MQRTFTTRHARCRRATINTRWPSSHKCWMPSWCAWLKLGPLPDTACVHSPLEVTRGVGPLRRLLPC